VKRFTLLLNAGSSKEGELHHESPRTSYVRNLGPATISRDGWLWVGVGCWLMPEQFSVQARPVASLTDRVIAEVLIDSMERAKALLGDRFAARRVA
jgi:hypothetical protein